METNWQNAAITPQRAMYSFLVNFIRPTLKALDPSMKGLASTTSAEKMLVMIASHESMGLRHSKQIRGPALGPYQMEPETFDDLWHRELEEPRKKDMKKICLDLLPRDMTLYEALERCGNFATAMARIKLWNDPAPLPSHRDHAALASYAKRCWNTHLGAATAKKYENDFMLYYPMPEPENWRF